MSRHALAALMGLAALAGLAAAGEAAAGIFDHRAKPKADANGHLPDAVVSEIQRAIDERRLADAGRLLDQAFATGAKDPQLMLLGGELDLARGRYSDALGEFRQVESARETRAKALEGKGIALSMLDRPDEALATLKSAVTEDPSAWRAWNALAGEYDRRRAWTDAEAAYDHAMADSDGAAIVLNNRGFSRLLQERLDAATDDLVAALKKQPDLATARTNLRLAMAMKGEYDRATAAVSSDDQAALLNNAGFGAMMRGDYVAAEDLLTRAMQAKGQFYARASDNLAMVHSLTARQGASSVGSH